MSAEGILLHAAASVAFAAGVPAFVWQSGEFAAAIVDNGVGDVTVSLAADQGVDVTEGAVFVTTRSAVIGNTASVDQLNDTDFRIRIATAAAAADVDFDIVILKRAII